MNGLLPNQTKIDLIHHRSVILGLQEVAHFQFRAGGRGNQEIRGGDRRQEHKIRQGQSSLIVQSAPVASNYHTKETTRAEWICFPKLENMYWVNLRVIALRSQEKIYHTILGVHGKCRRPYNRYGL